VAVIGRDEGGIGGDVVDPRLGSEARCWDEEAESVLVSGDDDGVGGVGGRDVKCEFRRPINDDEIRSVPTFPAGSGVMFLGLSRGTM
jgi:hypothetical protein